MKPSDVTKHLDRLVKVHNPKISGIMLFTAYILRIKDNKKLYQAEVQNVKAPHEIYIVSLDDIDAEDPKTGDQDPQR